MADCLKVAVFPSGQRLDCLPCPSFGGFLVSEHQVNERDIPKHTEGQDQHKGVNELHARRFDVCGPSKPEKV